MKLVQKQAACTSVNISHPSSVLTRVTTATRNQEGFQWSDYTVSRHTPTRVVTHADTRSVRSPPLSAFVSLWQAEEEKMIARIFHDCSHFVFHEDTNEEKEAEQERRRVLSAIRSWAVWRVLKLERQGGAPHISLSLQNPENLPASNLWLKHDAKLSSLGWKASPSPQRQDKCRLLTLNIIKLYF